MSVPSQDWSAFAGELGSKATLPQKAAELNAHLFMRAFLNGAVASEADQEVYDALMKNPRWTVIKKMHAKEYAHAIRWAATISAMQQPKEETSQDDGASWDIGIGSEWQGKVVTRFPPEPSGYLHIGHAKACIINDTIAKKFEGKMLVRFDDTNPTKESGEFVDAILADVHRLGVDFASVSHTSDHFDLLMQVCEHLLQKGVCYVDDTPAEEMKELRMNRQESPCRTRSVEENLALWQEMIKGTPRGAECCVRIKMVPDSLNGCLRDPVCYRCVLDAPHVRHGTKYKVYPTYDFCCPIVDSIEGVTHALRSIEYKDRDEQYARMWRLTVGDNAMFADRVASGELKLPNVTPFARQNFEYTVLSKRKLKWFVEEGRVQGWDDPRFPTIRGVMRRGLTLDALRGFCMEQATSKRTNNMEWDKIWARNKRVIDPQATRLFAVEHSSEATLVPLTVVDAADTDTKMIRRVPRVAEAGERALTLSKQVLIERADAEALVEGQDVVLMNWGPMMVTGIERDDTGSVTGVTTRLNLSEGDVKKARKVTWVARSVQPLQARLIFLGHLITTKKDGDANIEDIAANPEETWRVHEALLEAGAASLKKGDVVELMRKGFFIVDKTAEENNGVADLLYIPDGSRRK
ncbi:MAG: hypothetical protein MHM6MM_002665 [Cercozoa sp. M6MM]